MSFKLNFKAIPAAGVTLAVTDATGSVAVTRSRDLYIVNAGSNAAFIEVGGSATTAAVNTGMCILPGSGIIISGEGVTYLAGICTTGLTTTLYASPGVGN